MNKFISILLGLIFLAGGILAWGSNWIGFGSAALSFLKGGLVWFVLFVGFILVVIGISEIAD